VPFAYDINGNFLCEKSELLAMRDKKEKVLFGGSYER
jgi:hypothetical protein